MKKIIKKIYKKIISKLDLRSDNREQTHTVLAGILYSLHFIATIFYTYRRYHPILFLSHKILFYSTLFYTTQLYSSFLYLSQPLFQNLLREEIFTIKYYFSFVHIFHFCFLRKFFLEKLFLSVTYLYFSRFTTEEPSLVHLAIIIISF